MRKLRNILIIDDEEISAFVTTKLIENAGITDTITQQPGGFIALEQLKSMQKKRQKGPDAILLDLHMADMSGWQFMKEYGKLDPAFKSGIAVFILSNFVNDKEIKSAARFSDLRGIYLKPVSDELLEEISCIEIQN